MKNVLAVITNKLPAPLTKSLHIFENDKVRAVIKTKLIHSDAIIYTGVAFAKKDRFKDLGPAMVAAKNAGVKVKDIAAAAGCALSTAYKVISDTKKK